MSKRERQEDGEHAHQREPRARKPSSARALFEQVKATAYAAKDYQVNTDSPFEEQHAADDAVLVPAFVHINSQHAHVKPGTTSNVRQGILWRWHPGAVARLAGQHVHALAAPQPCTTTCLHSAGIYHGA